VDAEPTLRNAEQPIYQSSPFTIGQLLEGKYEILSLLGKGGMGSVYRVRHKLLNVDLALKTLDSAHLDDAQSSRRFQTEAKAAFSLKHPNLVKVHDFGVLDNGHPFLVMDLVQGKTLQAVIKERGQLGFSEIEPIFTQLCFGLAYAHQQQVVHRDIKPANIMLVDGVDLKTEGSVKILDFGIAKVVDADRGEMEALTQTGEIFGSPYYMSPEQCSGAAIDHRSDIYSLGCVLFEALTGTPPLVGSNALRTMMLHVNDPAPSLKEAALGTLFPPVFEQLVAKMLAKSPADRYSNLGAVAHEIHRACTGANYTTRILNHEPLAVGPLNSLQSNTFTFSRLQFISLVVVVFLVSSMATFCFSHYRRAYLDSENAAADENLESRENNIDVVGKLEDHLPSMQAKAEEEAKRAKAAYEKCLSISATDFDDAGVKKRRIVFPDYVCGVVIYNTNQSKGKKIEKITAIGEVIVPADVELNFRATEQSHKEAFVNSFIFDRIDPDLFDGLYFEGLLENNDILNENSSEPKIVAQAPGVIRLFKAASKWKKLTLLSLRKTEITKDLWDAVNELPHVNKFVVQGSQFEPRELAQQPLLARLNSFDCRSEDASEALRILSKSKMIKDITLGGEVVCSPQSLQSLSRASGLQNLYYHVRNVDDQTIDAITQLTQVSQIQFLRGVLTDSQEAKLSKNWTMDKRRMEPLAQFVDIYRLKR
jgi:serine/threonine protein kinase